ncbi:MAG TPA: Fe-S-containing hydro-lyase [Phycisphaerae bacterium]|nr:Fe-S-containing hydro-lyase [Phycisphaerae bacterium]
MVEPIRLTAPTDEATIRKLRAGDHVLINGTILTGRDAAHKRLCELIDAGRTDQLPVKLDGQIIYFVGPTPARPGKVIGSAGPTTSSRMDSLSPKLIALGLRGMIGKGYRSDEVRQAMQQHGCVHLAALGGLGALLGKAVKGAKVLAYEDLGTEAIRELKVEDFPAIVAYDSHGDNVYEAGVAAYRR